MGEGLGDVGEGLGDVGEGLGDVGEGLGDVGEGLGDVGEGLDIIYAYTYIHVVIGPKEWNVYESWIHTDYVMQYAAPEVSSG